MKGKRFAIPRLSKAGWTRQQEKCREASFDGADGVVFNFQNEFLELNNRPVYAGFGSFATIC